MIKREVITGRGGTPYMTRYLFGRLRVHVFHRGDEDPDPHTHPWDFWTFPLKGYWEEVFEPRTQERTLRYVKPWRLHYRRASHAHRVVGPLIFLGSALPSGLPKPAKWPVVTIVWRHGKDREWGCWVRHPFSGEFILLPWRRYLGMEPNWRCTRCDRDDLTAKATGCGFPLKTQRGGTACPMDFIPVEAPDGH